MTTKELEMLNLEKCPECHCPIGEDWEYKDFSNKTIIVCPQCKTEIDICEEYENH